jgi:uncharacterized protein YgiM (DUF1202 family)
MKTIVAASLAFSFLLGSQSFAADIERDPDTGAEYEVPRGTIVCALQPRTTRAGFVPEVSPNDPINLRKGPGLNYEVVDKFLGGEGGTVIARYGNWFRLSGYKDSPYTAGWFYGRYVNVARMSARERACFRIPRNFNPR